MIKTPKYKFWHTKFNKFVGPEEYVVDYKLNVFFVEHGPEGDILINCKDVVRPLENTYFKDKSGKPIFESDELIDNDGTIGQVIWSENALCLNKVDKEDRDIEGYFDKTGWAVIFQDLKHHPILLQKDTASLLTVIK